MLNLKVENLDGVIIDEIEAQELFNLGFLVPDIEKEQNRRIIEAKKYLDIANEKGLSEVDFLSIYEVIDNIEDFLEAIENL